MVFLQAMESCSHPPRAWRQLGFPHQEAVDREMGGGGGGERERVLDTEIESHAK